MDDVILGHRHDTSEATTVPEPLRASPKVRQERPKKSSVIRRGRRNIIKSSGRSLELLELFRDGQQPMRLTEIAAQLSLPQSSASMLVRSMVSMGYLVYAQKSRSYLPSMRLTLLGNWLNEGTFANGNLKTLVDRLSHLTGDTVMLATRNDTLVEVLGVTQGHMDTIFHTRPGDARPLTRALLGHMILSALNRTEVEGLVSRINSEQKLPERRVSYRSLVPILDGIRQNGHGFDDGETFPGRASIAMLLPKIPTGETLVIANAGSTERIRPRKEEVLKFMRAAIAEHFG